MEDYGSNLVWKNTLPQVDQAVGNGYLTPRRGGKGKPETKETSTALTKKAIPKKREVYNTLVPNVLKKTLGLNMCIITHRAGGRLGRGSNTTQTPIFFL